MRVKKKRVTKKVKTLDQGVNGRLLLQWKKRGQEPENSTATHFEVSVVSHGDSVDVWGSLDGRSFKMTASIKTGVVITHDSFRQNRPIKWKALIGSVSVTRSDGGNGFSVEFGKTVKATNDGAYRILNGSFIAAED